MQYALLIHEHPNTYDGLSDQEQQALTNEYLAVREDPRVVGGARLAPAESTSTVRAPGGDMVVTDGPFADAKEAFGGYFIVEADDLDAALEIAARVPAARMGGAVEVRPIMYQ